MNFLEKKINFFKSSLGTPALTRIDGNTRIIRFDKKNCRLFLFSDASENDGRVKYFEFRNNNGNLLTQKNNIDNCNEYFNLS